MLCDSYTFLSEQDCTGVKGNLSKSQDCGFALHMWVGVVT